VATSHN